MEAKRFRLEGATLPELQARVRAEHGDTARIVSAEQVTVGGIRGFFARRHVEVTVEILSVTTQVSEPVAPRRRRAAHARSELSTRLGIAALLDAADETEALLAEEAGRGTAPAPDLRTSLPRPAPLDVPSTASPDFARLMDELTFATAPAEPAVTSPPVSTPTVVSNGAGTLESATLPPEIPPTLSIGHPALANGPGDLVLLVGPSADVVEAGRLMSAGSGAPVLSGPDRPTDRRAALAARARGVQNGRSVLVTCAVPGSPDDATYAARLATLTGSLSVLGADQVWVIVDVGRKPADTARWVRDMAEALPIDAVAVLGVETTGTPGTVRQLGLPIGWLASAEGWADSAVGVHTPAGPAPAGPSNPFAIG